jgi:hypothetical protein
MVTSPVCDLPDLTAELASCTCQHFVELFALEVEVSQERFERHGVELTITCIKLSAEFRLDCR